MSQGIGYYPIDMTSLAAPGTAVGTYSNPNDPMVGWLRRDVAGMPVWGWVVGLSAVGAGLLALSKAQEQERTQAASAASRLEANSKPWAPSRSGVATELSDWLRQNGHSGCAVIADADDAAKKHAIKNPSPLINLKLSSSGSALDQNPAFKALLAQHGLEPVRVEEEVVGLVPNKGSERSAEWERYIDALREEGQTV